DRKQFGKGDAYLFDAIEPTHWHGALGNVFCVDFSVGGRYQERRSSPQTHQTSKLAALRWPERTLVLDSGETFSTGGYRG
ncbi:MAG: metallophosphoesterase, partial [Pseudomonadales bacterium]|nr:metallophosphoesterase [Pseudomonadales bacterium]